MDHGVDECVKLDKILCFWSKQVELNLSTFIYVILNDLNYS